MLEVVVKIYWVLATGWDLETRGDSTRVVRTDSGTGGVAAIVTPAEAGAEGVVFMLVEVEVVGGTSGLRTEVAAVMFLTFATLLEG